MGLKYGTKCKRSSSLDKRDLICISLFDSTGLPHRHRVADEEEEVVDSSVKVDKLSLLRHPLQRS